LVASPSPLQKLCQIVFRVSPTGSLFPAPHIYVADLTIMNQRVQLILSDLEAPRGFLAVQEIA
jgi:hypothetical protein